MKNIVRYDNNAVESHADRFAGFFQAPASEFNASKNCLVPIRQRQIVRPPVTHQSPMVRHTLSVTKTQKLTIRYMGIAPLFEGHRSYPTGKVDWLLMPIEEDPLYEKCGNRLLIPERPKADIRRITDAGLNFERIYIAHEVLPNRLLIGRSNSNSQAGTSIPVELLTPPPSKLALANAEKQTQLATSVEQMAVKALKSLAKITVGFTVAATVATATIAAAPLALAAGLDPILFGVNPLPNQRYNEQPVGEWFYLTHWFWGDEEQANG